MTAATPTFTASYTYTNTTTHTSSQQKKPSRFIEIVKLVWAVVKLAFKSLGSLFSKKKSPLDLTQKEIEMIKNSNPAPPPTRPSASTRPVSTSSPLSSSLSTSLSAMPPIDGTSLTSLVQNVQRKEPLPLPEITDPVMREFHEVTLKAASVIIDAVFEEKVEPHLKHAKEGINTASDALKFGAELAIKIGDKAAKPLFDKLNKLKQKTRPELIHSLNWLMRELNQATFKQELTGKLDVKEFNIPSERDINVNACIQWLFQSDHKQSINDFCAAKKLDGKKIDIVFQTALLLMIEKKIEKFSNVCQVRFNDKLPGIIRQSMQENSQRITDILLHRMIELLQNASQTKIKGNQTLYNQMYDDLLEITVKQTKALIAVEKAKEGYSKTYAQANDALYQMPKNENQKESKRSLEDWLKRHEAALQKVAEEKYAKLDEGEKDNKKSLCHPDTKKLIENPALSPKEREAIQEALFKDVAEQIISLLLPQQKIELPDGTIHKVNGLVFLLNQIELPAEVRAMIQEAMSISKEILTPETQTVIKEFYETFMNIAYSRIEKILLKQIKFGTKQAIMYAFREVFDKFVIRARIDGLMAEDILPAVQKQIVKAMARHVISADIKGFAGLFTELTAFKLEQGAERDTVLKKIMKKTGNKSSDNCQQYNEEFKKISDEQYEKLVMPLILSIEGAVRFLQAKEGTTPAVVEKALEGFFATIYREDIPMHGDFVVDLMLDVGKIHSSLKDVNLGILSMDLSGLINNFRSSITKTLSKEMTAVAHPYRQSPRELVSDVTKEIKDYLNPAKIKTLLFKKKKPLDPKDLDAHLQREISNVAKIAYDLIMQKVSNDTINKFAVTQVLTADSKHLANVIMRIYRTVLQSRLMTQNALVRYQECVVQAMAQSAEALAKSSPPKPIKMDKVPTLIPECFTA